MNFVCVVLLWKSPNPVDADAFRYYSSLNPGVQSPFVCSSGYRGKLL